jgi:non-heme chloroperoxidase
MSESTYPTTAEQVDRCNETGRTPVVFVHGLWLLPNSWDRWAAVYTALAFVQRFADAHELQPAGPALAATR